MSREISSDSKKEEIADYFQKNFKINDEAKNNLIKEDISGDILLDISDNEFKSLGIKVGQFIKIKKFIKGNEDKFKNAKEIKVKITSKSSPQQVKNFLESCLNFRQNDINIDGKRLLELGEEEMDKLGFNLGQKKKLVKYIDYFKTLPPEEEEEKEKEVEEEIIIHRNSSEQDVSNFLRKKSHLSQEIIDSLGFDAEGLLDLEDNEIDGIEELNDNEKNNLKNSLKENKEKLNQKNKEKTYKNSKEIEHEIKITEKSSEEDVSKFLMKKLNFSEKSINELQLDGESLFLLEIEDVDGLNITQSEKKKLKEFLLQIGKKSKENKKIEITYDSNKKEAEKFLVEKLGLNKETTKKLDLDGETLFLLDEKDINEMDELSKREKEEFIKVLKEIKINITDASNNSDVSEFLKFNLGFEDKSIENCKNLTGRKLLSLSIEEVDKMKLIADYDRKKLKRYVNLINIKIDKNSNKTVVAKFLKTQLYFSFKSIKKLNLDGQNFFSLNEEKINKIDYIKKEEKDMLKHMFKKPDEKINEIEDNYKSNIFFFITMKNKQRNNINLKI